MSRPKRLRVCCPKKPTWGLGHVLSDDGGARVTVVPLGAGKRTLDTTIAELNSGDTIHIYRLPAREAGCEAGRSALTKLLYERGAGRLEAVGGNGGRCRRGLPGLRAHVGPRHGFSGCESQMEPLIAAVPSRADRLWFYYSSGFQRMLKDISMMKGID